MKRLLAAILVAASGFAAADQGERAYEASLKGDYATELSITRPAAERGEAWAQDRLGDSYLMGKGVAIDPAEANRWYRRAAEQGHRAAQMTLAVSLSLGRGVPQNQEEASKWYAAAAE